MNTQMSSHFKSFYDFSSWFTELSEIAEKFGKEKNKVNSDEGLSPQGKRQKVQVIELDKTAALSKFKEKFSPGMSRLRQVEEGKISGPEKELSETEKLLGAVNQLNFALQVSGMSREQVNDLALKLFESEDLETLTQLKEATKYNQENVSLAAAQFINQLREKNLTPEQREALERLKELEYQISLVQYSIQNLEERGEFVDPRNYASGQTIDSSELAQLGRGR